MHMATAGQDDSRDGLRAALRWILAAFYLAAGIAHLMVPDGFLPIVPGWVPWPRETVLATESARSPAALASSCGALRVHAVRKWRAQ
jgi:uncharacterized membrane protein